MNIYEYLFCSIQTLEKEVNFWTYEIFFINDLIFFLNSQLFHISTFKNIFERRY